MISKQLLSAFAVAMAMYSPVSALAEVPADQISHPAASGAVSKNILEARKMMDRIRSERSAGLSNFNQIKGYTLIGITQEYLYNKLMPEMYCFENRTCPAPVVPPMPK